jgi:histidyl-tRNA synthetase
VLALQAEGIDPAAEGRVDVYGVALGAQAKATLVPVLAEFRRSGLRADMAYGDRGMKGAFKAADRSGAAITVVVGENELATSTAVVKTMATGEQEPVPLEGLVDHVTRAVSR